MPLVCILSYQAWQQLQRVQVTSRGDKLGFVHFQSLTLFSLELPYLARETELFLESFYSPTVNVLDREIKAFTN